MMDRRRFVLLAGASITLEAMGGISLAQDIKLPRIAYVSNSTPNDYRVQRWRDGLRDLGYTEGENVEIKYFYYDKFDELPEVVTEVLASQPDIIMSLFTPTTLAFKKATTSIPIVFSNIADPVYSDVVKDLASPGGNLTGVSIMTSDIAGQRLEILTQLVPDAKQIAAFYNPGNPAGKPQLDVAIAASKTIGVEIRPVEARGGDDWDALLDELAAEGAQALFFVTDQTFTNDRDRIAAAALKHQLPSILDHPNTAEAGNLAAYGPDFSDHYIRAAHYVIRVLEGARPGDMPIERPTKFTFVLNLKTARALGITVPPKLMLQATELIE